jgi:hypothetical protein
MGVIALEDSVPAAHGRGSGWGSLASKTGMIAERCSQVQLGKEEAAWKQRPRLDERFGYGIGEKFATWGEDEIAICFAKEAEVDELAAFGWPGFQFTGGNSVPGP